MNRQTFTDKYGGDFKKFIESPAGQAFVVTLNALAPPYEFSEKEHLFAENRGAKRGYELCLRNILTLLVPIKTKQEPEANYGVNPKP